MRRATKSSTLAIVAVVCALAAWLLLRTVYEKLPPLPAELKTESNRVRGCMSLVHIFARKRPGTADTIDFLADSDAAIVRGLIALLQKVYSGQQAQAIVSFDIESLLNRLGLNQHLSMGRRNGLAGMIGRIRSEAVGLRK